MDRTRLIFILIVGAALITVGAVFFLTGSVEPVTGLVGSEKIPFFEDAHVQDALRSHGLDVSVQKAGSREIATSYDLEAYDFVFPAGVPAAEKIQRENNVGSAYNSFFTPMVVGTWEPIAQLLVEQGVARAENGYYWLEMDAFFELMAAGTRWNELENNDAFDVNRSILIISTDVRTSNSAAMYLSLASYVANEDSIVQSLRDADPLLPVLADLYLRQGFRPSSSQEPFEDYLVKGMGHSPMVMMYEAQFIAQAAQQPGSVQPEMVLMYPVPTIFTKHVLIPLSEEGEKLGELLESDPELQRLAVEYGLRNTNIAYFREFTAEHDIQLPGNIVSVVEPPDYDVLEGMIQAIERQYAEGGQER